MVSVVPYSPDPTTDFETTNSNFHEFVKIEDSLFRNCLLNQVRRYTLVLISSYNNFSSLSAEDKVLYFLINGLLKASKIAENFVNNVHADVKISINQKVSRFQVCFSNS